MVQVFRFTLPTYLPVGPVNVYLIKNKPYTLIDAGPNNEEAFATLLMDLRANGIEPHAIERIVLTHGHSDHIGAVNRLLELTRAQVWIHADDLTKIHNGFWQYDESLLLRLGLPFEEVASIVSQLEERRKNFHGGLAQANQLKHAQLLFFDDFHLEVIHTPGHSPGSICLHEPKTKALFSGDHLLAGIVPNPLMETNGMGSWTPTARQYLNSLEYIREFQPTVVYPGHGDPFINPEEHIDKTIANYDVRMQQLEGLLNAKPRTVYDLTKSIYPRAQSFDLYLAISKVLGLLDILESRGQASLQLNTELITCIKTS